MKFYTIALSASLTIGAAASASALSPVVDASAANLPGVAVELVAEGLTAPIDLLSPADRSGRRFVVDQTGVVHILSPEGARLPTPFLDLRDRLVPLIQGFDERGLLGFAFHPGYAQNGRFFVSYSAPLRPTSPPGWNYTRRISEFTVSAADPNLADPQSERVLIEQDWPSRKHNGGGLAFGPDGQLYIGFGDAGGIHGVGPDVLFEAFEIPKYLAEWDRLAQDTESLYGKILRIDVDRGYPGYAIPPLNPFSGDAGRDEIFAWGIRNPFRLSFDGDDLFVTAVGETLWESVYLVDRPGNYGWAMREGTHCFDRYQPKAPPAACPTSGVHGEPFIDPIIEYPNMSVGLDGVELGLQGVGTAVVGGHVYRGGAIDGLTGRYVFGDWSHDFMKPSGQLFVATPPQEWGALWSITKVLELPGRILSLGRGADNELYVLTNDELGPFGNTGKVYKLVPASP